MQIRTKVPVNRNNGVNGTVTEIVYGYIESASWMSDFTQIGINYSYGTDIEGEFVPFYKDGFVIDEAEIQAFYDAVKDNIPTGLNYNDQQRTTYYLAMIIQMAQTFGIPTTDVEIVA